MALPVNYNTVEVRGKFVGTDGTPVTGRVVFTPKAKRLVDTIALTTIIGRSIAATLDSGGGFAIEIPATDDPDLTPTDFTYEVREDFTGGSTYQIEVPLAYSSIGIELAVVAPVQPVNGVVPGVSRLELDALIQSIGQFTVDPDHPEVLNVTVGGSVSLDDDVLVVAFA